MALHTLSAISGALGRRASLSFGTVAGFVAVDLLLVAACLLAMRQNVWLRGEVASDVALLTPANGTVVPPLTGEDPMGAAHTIGYNQDQRPTLVYAFSKECGHSSQNWRAMHPLQELAPRLLRIAYIDTFNDLFTPAYLASSGIGQSALLVRLSPQAAVTYNPRAVPQLLLVDQHGRVQWSHVGELAPDDVSKALSLIKHD